MKRLFHHCKTPPTTPVNTPLEVSHSSSSSAPSATGRKTKSTADYNDTTDDYCDDLQSSLKRVRISTSPGELRLDRDLQELGWSTSQRHLTDTIALERSHALGIILHVLLQLGETVPVPFTTSLRIQLDFPRLYPHIGPTIVKLDAYNAYNYINKNCMHTTTSTTETTQLRRLLAIEWSPIMTLKEYLTMLLQQLSAAIATNTATADTTTTDTMVVDAIDSPTKYKTLFSENRFNLGYTRPTTTTKTTMLYQSNEATTTLYQSSSNCSLTKAMEC